MRQYVVYAKLITSTNRRRSDGTPLDGWHGVSGRRSGSSLFKFIQARMLVKVVVFQDIEQNL